MKSRSKIKQLLVTDVSMKLVRSNTVFWITASIILVCAACLLWYGDICFIYRSLLETDMVETECGLVTGIIEIVEDSDKIGYVFKGIPYAKAPVGELRWKAPVRLNVNDKKDCWAGIYAADKFGTQCAQGSGNDSEDCLFLNVYTPTLDRTSKLPVFVWIHGGDLMRGNGSTHGYHPDSEFVTSMNVVGVSMNYRLNAFGFLTLEELWEPGVSYGNYGLMDQILVLKWVQKNVEGFGGDPNLVTICGQSSGGTSIFGLLASPIADGLFHRAVSMSGSTKFEKSYIDAAKDNRVFIRNANCSKLSLQSERKECLYNLSATEVLSAIPNNVYPNWGMYDVPDFPTKGLLDGALAVVDPIVVLKPPKDIKELTWRTQGKVSVLIGSMAQELGLHPRFNFINKTYTDYKSYLKKRLDPFSPNFVHTVLEELYTNLISNHTVEWLHETVASDVRENCPSSRLRKDISLSEHHVVFQYIGDEAPSQPVHVLKFVSRNAFHAWDSFVLFNFSVFQNDAYIPSVYDRKFQQSLRENLKHFMVFGEMKEEGWNAGKTGLFNGKGFVDILKTDYHKIECDFWNDPANGFIPYAWIN